MSISIATNLLRFGFIMTDGVIMYYYAQHTRPITELAGIKGPSKFGSRCHHPAGCAVTELRARLARDWRKHTAMPCRVLLLSCVVRSNIERKVQYNILKRSIINYTVRALKALAKASAPASAPHARRGFFKGGYPFMFISPFDLKIMYNKSGEAGTMFAIARN